MPNIVFKKKRGSNTSNSLIYNPSPQRSLNSRLSGHRSSSQTYNRNSNNRSQVHMGDVYRMPNRFRDFKLYKDGDELMNMT
jgi:hypothetical protein